MPEAPKKTFRFKLLRGRHSEGGVTYSPGDIIETHNDLLKHNRLPAEPQYASLDDVVQTQASNISDDEGLDEMTVAELRSYAEEGDIDISGANTKAEIRAKLKAAM